MKFLILGSEGQIGKPTTKYLRYKGHEVVEWDIKLKKNHDLRTMTDDLIDTMNSCDFVYYFASDVGGAKYLEKHQDTFEFIKNNMDIMSNTFNCLKITKKPFIFTSSQMSELSHSTYGLLKKIGETITKDLGGIYVRLWNVYGPEEDEEKSHVITDFCRMAKNDGVIKMRTDGTESRQLLYAEDCADCLLTLTELYDTLNHDKNYHITNFNWNTIMDVANCIKSISNCEIISSSRKDETQKNAMNEPDPYILNFWQPKTNLKEGILKIYNIKYL